MLPTMLRVLPDPDRHRDLYSTEHMTLTVPSLVIVGTAGKTDVRPAGSKEGVGKGGDPLQQTGWRSSSTATGTTVER